MGLKKVNVPLVFTERAFLKKNREKVFVFVFFSNIKASIQTLKRSI